MQKLKVIADSILLSSPILKLEANIDGTFGGDCLSFYNINENPIFPDPMSHEDVHLINIIKESGVYGRFNSSTKSMETNVDSITKNCYRQMCIFMIKVYATVYDKKVTRRNSLFSIYEVKHPMVTMGIENMYLTIVAYGVTERTMVAHKDFLKPFALTMKKLGEQYGRK